MKAEKSEIFLEVYIETARFAVDSVMRLGERLRIEYCDFNRVSVNFYDTKKLDKMPDPPPHPLLDWESKTPMRGIYELDRKENKEELIFRERKNGKATTVVFKSDGYCVSEI